MTSVAPPAQPTHKTAFTDADLTQTRGASAALAAPPSGAAPLRSSSAAVAAVPAAGASIASSSAAPAPRAASASDDELQKWQSRLRDREDDVQSAQAKVRRLEIEVEARRTRAASLASDPAAQDKAQDEVNNALDDLEKGERKLSDKQRDLDETKDQARAAGFRLDQR